MKKALQISWVLTIFLIGLISCKDDERFENTAMPESDAIHIKIAKEDMIGEPYIVGDIPAKSASNSFIGLLGTYNHDVIGKIDASILSQFDKPGQIYYPNTVVEDSTKLYLYIKGKTLAEKQKKNININIHELTQSLDYKGDYTTGMDATPFYNPSILEKVTLVADTFINNNNNTTISLPEDIKNKFVEEIKNEISLGNNRKGTFENTALFNEFFKGLYFSFGDDSETIISITQLDLHFSYQYKLSDGQLATQTYAMPASTFVKQIGLLKRTLPTSTSTDSTVLICSPAGTGMKFSLSIENLKNNLGITTHEGKAYTNTDLTKKVAVNSAILSIKADSINSTVSKPEYLLLIEKDEMENFFKQSSLPNDINSILAPYNSTTKAYTFTLKQSLSQLFNSELTSVSYVIIPVSVTLINGRTSRVEHDYNMEAIQLNKKLTLSVVISGF